MGLGNTVLRTPTPSPRISVSISGITLIIICPVRPLMRPHESREKLRRNETGYPVLQTPHRILLTGNRSKYPTRPSFPAGRFVLVSMCFIFRKAMVLVMMSIPMHMMAAGSLSGMEHGVPPITTNLGNQVSILQGFPKKNSVIRNLKIGQIEAFRHFLRTANVKKWIVISTLPLVLRYEG